MGEADDAHLVERCIGSEVLLRGSFLHVHRAQVALPDGGRATREYIEHPGAVLILPLLDDGKLLLERQYRYPLQRVLLEFPAGKIDPGEDTLVCAQRELREETGYRAREWAYAGTLHNAPAYSDERIEIWFARGLIAGAPQLDDGEFIELVALGEDELDARMLDGSLTDAKTLIALQWLQRWRAGAWTPAWQAAATMAP